MILFILIAGLRWRLGIDTPPYLYHFYHDYPYLSDFSFKDYYITDSPLYVLLNSVVKSFGGRFYVVQLIHSAFINFLIFNFFKKNCEYIFTCVFFYAITCYFAFNMEIMRGSLSIVLCLYANDYILNKKWFKGYLLYFIAFLFHPQSIVLFIIPLFFFLKFNKYGIIACLSAFFIGKIVMDILGEYIFLFEANESFSSKISSYVNSDLYGTQGGNINFFIVNVFPMLFYVVVSFFYVKLKHVNLKILRYESLIVLGICFIMIRMNIEIAYRYIDYFLIYFALFYSELFIGIIKRALTINIGFAYVKSCIVFIPFFVLYIALAFMHVTGPSFRYIPYTSVIERTINVKRENRYVEMNLVKSFFPSPDKNEY